MARVIPQRVETNHDPADLERWKGHLAAWVPWLVDTHRPREANPPCWLEHAQLVEELTVPSWLVWRNGATARPLFARRPQACSGFALGPRTRFAAPSPVGPRRPSSEDGRDCKG